jgi:hypothetical protein
VSLSFLTKGKLADTLTELMLSNFSRAIPLTELDNIHQLRKLRRLTLWSQGALWSKGFDAALVEEIKRRCEPPSLLCPSLEDFTYC